MSHVLFDGFDLYRKFRCFCQVNQSCMCSKCFHWIISQNNNTEDKHIRHNVVRHIYPRAVELLYCLSFFDLRLLITNLASSNFPSFLRTFVWSISLPALQYVKLNNLLHCRELALGCYAQIY
jgi:hypothetical protein